MFYCFYILGNSAHFLRTATASCLSVLSVRALNLHSELLFYMII